MGPLRRVLACTFYWQDPLAGAVSIPAMLAFAVWALSRLSPLDRVPTNNRAAALGVLAVAGLALAYAAWRLGNYARSRVRRGVAADAPPWPVALIDAGRYAATTVLVTLLLLAALLGREGHPLVRLGNMDNGPWFVAGLTAALAGLALTWPAWTLERPPRRLMPYVPSRPDRGA